MPSVSGLIRMAEPRQSAGIKDSSRAGKLRSDNDSVDIAVFLFLKLQFRRIDVRESGHGMGMIVSNACRTDKRGSLIEEHP